MSGFNFKHLFSSKEKITSEQDDKFMIVGLGNPGREYEGTRHNIGFIFLDQLAEKYTISLTTRKFQAVFGSGVINEQNVILVKPMTYMNLSGQAVAQISKYYKIPPQRILVISDDLDLPVGKMRLRAKGGSGGQRGHKSIIESLKTENYPRLRIGIGKPERGEVSDYVLSKFSHQERKSIDVVLQNTQQACEIFLKEGIAAAMNKISSL